jgi:predicted HAD superfamily phosphohydrolase
LLNVPKATINGDAQYADQKSSITLETVGKMIDDINGTEFMGQLDEMKTVGGNEKSFALMDLRRRTEVDLDCTVYIGNNSTDYSGMSIVRDNDGLSISMNGDEHAVRGSGIAVMSPDSIIPAVLVSEFYISGMEGVYSLIDMWDDRKFSKYEPPDRHLWDSMLKKFPAKLPDVIIVDDDNLDDVIKESERYRRKLKV